MTSCVLLISFQILIRTLDSKFGVVISSLVILHIVFTCLQIADLRENYEHVLTWC